MVNDKYGITCFNLGMTHNKVSGKDIKVCIRAYKKYIDGFKVEASADRFYTNHFHFIIEAKQDERLRFAPAAEA